MAEKLSKILPNDQIQLLKKKNIIFYKGDDDDKMMIKQKLQTQYNNYELVKISDIINDYLEYSLIDSLHTIEDLSDIELAHQQNKKVLILKKAYSFE